MRGLRKLKRSLAYGARVVELTLSGNTVDKKSDLTASAHPVLLIQGFGSTRRTVSIIERRLQRNGYPVISLNLGGVFKTFNAQRIESLAEVVRDKIEALYRRYQFKGRMSVIGHSKGGLIARYYVQCLGGNKRVRNVITLGTPHNGTIWATLGMLTPLGWCTASLRQMTPFSSLIRTLKDTPFPRDVSLLSIYSHSDRFIPYPSAVIEGAERQENIRNICVDGVGHLEFVIRKSVFSHIKQALRDAELREEPLQKKRKHS